MTDPASVQGWSKLLLALPDSLLTDPRIDEHNELVVHIEWPRDVQGCPRCGVTDLHPLHD